MVFAVLTACSGYAKAGEEPGLVDMRFMDEYWKEVEKEVSEYFPRLHWREVVEWVKPGEKNWPRMEEVFQGVVRYLFGEVLLNFSFMGKLLVLAVAAAFLKNIQSAFENQNVAWMTQGVIFIVLIGLVLPGFIASVEIASSTIDLMVDFMLALIPILLILLASLGSISAAAIFHPVIIFSVHFFGTMIRNIIFPLIYFSVAIGLVHHLYPHIKLGKLSDFFRDLCVWGLGLMMTLFVGLVTLQGVGGTVADAVTLRTAKYLTTAFIPVVGKMLADSLETVASASILFKNGVGLAGLITLIMITIFPTLKLLALVLIYKVTSALVQFVGETPLGDCLNTMGNCLILVMASVAAVSVIFFLAVVVIVGSGNALLMFR